MTRTSIYRAIEAERDRQELLWADDHTWGRGSCASHEVPEIVKVAVLTEECGEVARAVLEYGPNPVAPEARKLLRTELIQVAAVCVAWLESI